MPEIYHDVVHIKCLDNFNLEVTFDDGKSGILDCKPIIEKGGVFSKLRDPDVFNKAEIHKDLGVITWNNEIDIAPETAYSLATGEPLPEWMEKSRHVV
ncbi:MAG: DUF2442 domain-containing protein [Planctomycetota bacterium]